MSTSPVLVIPILSTEFKCFGILILGMVLFSLQNHRVCFSINKITLWVVPGYYETYDERYRENNFDEEGNIKDPIRKQILDICVIKDEEEEEEYRKIEWENYYKSAEKEKIKKDLTYNSFGDILEKVEYLEEESDSMDKDRTFYRKFFDFSLDDLNKDYFKVLRYKKGYLSAKHWKKYFILKNTWIKYWFEDLPALYYRDCKTFWKKYMETKGLNVEMKIKMNF